MADRLSKAEILERYPDPEFHDRLLKLQALSDFLNTCIVDDSYDVPARLVAPIRLTSAGSTLVNRIQSNANPRSECILAVFLELWWTDLLVDPLETEVEPIVQAASDEIRRFRARYPYIHGRLLYDKAFEEYPDARDILSHKDTLGLLAATPQGVFQLDEFVSGPYGLLRSRACRYLRPTVDVHLYHCEDLSCGVFHRTRLTTGMSKISKVHTKLRDLLDKRRQIPSDWAEVLVDRVDAKVNPFSWRHSGGLIRFIGDAFSLRELKLIVGDLLDTTKGALRRSLEVYGIRITRAEEFISSIGAAEALQVILLCEDTEIIETIDSLILGGEIAIPSTEIRQSKVGQGGGYFRLRPECSSQGLRFDGSNDLTLLRVRHLLSTLFDATSLPERERLDWLIRRIEGGSFQERLDRFVCDEDLARVVRSLTFDSRRNLDATKAFVSLGPRASAKLNSEDVLASAINWRLGIGRLSNDEQLRLFVQFGTRLRELVMRTHNYSATDQAEIVGAASNFFRGLEGLLRSYLSMATWALCRDHYGSAEGFIYSESQAARFCADTLSSAQSAILYSPDGKWTLYPLIRGFAVLADYLSVLDLAEATKRPESDYPQLLTRNSGPYSFLFKHRHAFLDLSVTSKKAILSLLQEASRKLAAGRVDETRNLLGHNNPFPGQGELLGAVNAAEAVVLEAEEAGFLPIVAELQDEHRDEFGRRSMTIGTARGKTVRLVRPSPHFLSGAPAVSAPQFIVRSAVYADSNELLRLGVSDESDYAKLWRNFPRRRGEALNADVDNMPPILGS